MAIPNWLWPDGGCERRTLRSSQESLDIFEIESATGIFEVLANPIRLEILSILYEKPDPITYTELREGVNVKDKGKFNYHLRRLEPLVWNQDGKYTLADRGETLIRTLTSSHG